MPFLNGEVGGISKHVPTVEKEGCASSDESHVSGCSSFLIFLHGLRRCDSLFRSCWRERRLRRMCVHMYVYVCMYCSGYVYFTCPCILRVKSRTYKHLMVQYKLPTLPSLAAWLPLVLTSVTPSLCRNKGSLCPRHEVRMVPLFRAMRACLWIFQRLG